MPLLGKNTITVNCPECSFSVTMEASMAQDAVDAHYAINHGFGTVTK